MKTPTNCPVAIRDKLSSTSDSAVRFLWSPTASASLKDLVHGTSLGGGLPALSGRSVLLATRDPMAAALALIELDGVAARLIICPADMPNERLHPVIAKGGVNAIVADFDALSHGDPAELLRVKASNTIQPMSPAPLAHYATEWVLLTSGTTGAPKMVLHSLESLSASIKTSQEKATDVVWGTFYDIRRYGGLQILLRALLGNGSLVVSGPAESLADYLLRLGAYGATHISGTPSHWRRVLMSPQARAIAPRYVRLSGEIADQKILDSLRSFYPQARIVHAFASTEAGLGFEINDGLEGFPLSVVSGKGDVEVKIDAGSLRIRSARTAMRWVGAENGVFADGEGFVDTGDIVERRGDRYYFLGRRSGVINVGGMKVYPEEVEAVINRHPSVRMSIVRPRKSPIIGSLVSADVVLNQAPGESANNRQIEDCKREILQICRASLDRHKVPVTIRCVPMLEVAATGKLARHYV